MIVFENCKKILLLICICISLAGTRRKYPRIQDVISFSDIHELYEQTFIQTIESPMDGYIPRVLKEIKSTIDIERLKINEELLRRQIRGNLENTVVFEKPVETRRVQIYKNVPGDYGTAVDLQFRTKIIDCMLQLVYMARHYLKLFERNEYINKNSPAYRIGVIARKLKELYKKSTRILEMLNNKQKKDLWVRDPTSAPALTLHHKVAKMHVDFNYYYEVLKRLHAKIREMKKLPKEKPPPKRFPQKWYDV